MADLKPLKLVDEGSGVGSLQEFGDDDTLDSGIVSVTLEEGTAASTLPSTSASTVDAILQTARNGLAWLVAQFDSAGNALTAVQLATARTIRTNLASTSTASFNGSANITPGVTGTLAVTNGGTGTATAPTAYAIPYAASTSELAYLAAGTSGYVLTAKGAAAPVWAKLGGAASYDIGTSGGTVPLLNTTNTWSANQTFTNVYASVGYLCKAGASATSYGNVFNWYWSGSSLQAWIDSTNVGTVSFSSDERVKQDIVSWSLSDSDFAAISTIQYRYADIGIFSAGDTQYGFSAQNLAEVFPGSVVGDVTAVDDEGLPTPAAVLDRPLLAGTISVVQRLLARVEALESQVAALSAST